MPKMRVVVADGDAEFRVRLVQFLENEEGISTVGQAKDGLEALFLLHTLRPDVVILEMSLTGLEVASRIKREAPQTKIVFVSAYEEKSYKTLSELLGADGYIQKKSLHQKLPGVLRMIRQDVLNTVRHEPGAPKIVSPHLHSA